VAIHGAKPLAWLLLVPPQFHEDRRPVWSVLHGIPLLLLLVVARPLAAQVHSITDLGTLGGAASEASAINGSGQVVGWSMTASGATHGFLYTNGVMTSLGTLRGGTSSRATGINDHGQVVGSSGVNEYGPEFREFQQGFVWQNGTMRALGSLFCPCKFNQRYGTSAAYGINASGQVVGDSGHRKGWGGPPCVPLAQQSHG
jgi:probable HAF family extracellular repeat protein